MLRQRSWTAEEVETLRSLYPTFGSFRELLDELPGRSPNSVRLMASRLGLHRPSLIPGIEGADSPGAPADGDTYVKCSRCGEWFAVSRGQRGRVASCTHCNGYSFVSD